MSLWLWFSPPDSGQLQGRHLSYVLQHSSLGAGQLRRRRVFLRLWLSHLPAQGSFGAATCCLGSSTYLPTQDSSVGHRVSSRLRLPPPGSG
jgi:hypothetical protein